MRMSAGQEVKVLDRVNRSARNACSSKKHGFNSPFPQTLIKFARSAIQGKNKKKGALAPFFLFFPKLVLRLNLQDHLQVGGEELLPIEVLLEERLEVED
jgi:hypothetical protein